MAGYINTYNLNSKSMDDAVNVIQAHLSSKNMETQFFMRDNYYIVQARTRGGKLKQVVGLDKTIEVRMTPVDDGRKITVEIGGAKWVDKSVVVTVSVFVLWPLAVTSGFGFYGQHKIIKDTRNFVESYFNS